jgi:16S rRNA (cytosine967-C5)-methyltransferase
VRWLRKEDEVKQLIKLQRELIAEGWAKVKPGGFLAYSVCSVFQDEGPRAIEKAVFPDEPIRTWFLTPQQAPYGDGF